MTQQEAKNNSSAAIVEAQARLIAMRTQHRRSYPDQNFDHDVLPDGRDAITKDKHQARFESENCTAYPAIGALPDHLGWGSQTLSQTLRQSLRINHQRNIETVSERAAWVDGLQNLLPPTLESQAVERASVGKAAAEISASNDLQSRLSLTEVALGTIKLQPDIGLGILRRKMAAAGRIWLLLRWADKSGSGRIEIAKARSLLCDRYSAIRVCGGRQLRSLIRQGCGIFWVQSDGRLWLQSIPKVAQALAVERLTTRPVALPVKMLIQGIGQVRAHLFASFHSGRKHASPISRTTLTQISRVSPRSQQNYEKRSRIRKQKNFAIGHKISGENAKDQAWQHGAACFNWHDHQALHGSRDTSFLAWQLPNSYLGPHEQRPFGRQKQFNRELADLFAKGMTGNDQATIELKPKRYFAAAKRAARAQDHLQTGVYWRGKHPGLWYFMEPSEEL